MDSSDPQRTPAADPAPGNPEAAKDAEPPQAAPPPAGAPAEPDASSDEPELLLPSEADAIEHAHFEMLKRETTQPVRAYSFPSAIAPAQQPPPAWTEPDAAEPTRPLGFEPAPFAVPPPAEPAAEPPPDEPVAPDPSPSAPGPDASEPNPLPDPIAYAPTYQRSEPASAPPPYEPPYDEPSYEQVRLPDPLEPAPPEHTPPEPVPPEPVPVEPSAYVAQVPAAIERPQPAFSIEPSHDLRFEPAFDAPLAASPVTDAAAPPMPVAPPQRDWRDLVRRAASAAFLIFVGWFLAVLVLILAYRLINPPFSMLMAQRFLGGTLIDKEWVPIERISPNLTRAVIVAEDGRFCQHWGVDFIEAANAIRRSSTGYPRGASTITMQVAKNLFLVPAKSYLRKIIEIPLTFAIELVWPKQRTLEIYLNIVEWGPGIFGAEAAARAHFGRSAASLTARQAAQLAAVLPNPIARDAGSPGRSTANKASIIQARAARTREASACVDPRR
ncbi:MAG: monofunctional biosynthetic peptidoglycan transglycosylase [Hyphomicrobium sp.]